MSCLLNCCRYKSNITLAVVLLFPLMLIGKCSTCGILLKVINVKEIVLMDLGLQYPGKAVSIYSSLFMFSTQLDMSCKCHDYYKMMSLLCRLTDHLPKKGSFLGALALLCSPWLFLITRGCFCFFDTCIHDWLNVVAHGNSRRFAGATFNSTLYRGMTSWHHSTASYKIKRICPLENLPLPKVFNIHFFPHLWSIKNDFYCTGKVLVLVKGNSISFTFNPFLRFNQAYLRS